MSLLRHKDKSFRNITAAWGGLQRSQAALICSAGKTSPLCPPSPASSLGSTCPGVPQRADTNPTRAGHEKHRKEWVFLKKNSPCSRLSSDTHAVGMGLLRDQSDLTAPGQIALPQTQILQHKGFQKYGLPFPALAAVIDMSDKTK